MRRKGRGQCTRLLKMPQKMTVSVPKFDRNLGFAGIPKTKIRLGYSAIHQVALRVALPVKLLLTSTPHSL